LKGASPCFESGQLYKDLLTDYEGAAPDIGAYEGSKLVMGPAFKFSVPEAEIPFKEHPRITRYKIADKRLTMWFSMPMDSKQVIKSKPFLQTENMSIPVKIESIEDDGYCFRFTLETEVDTESDLVLVLTGWPTGLNGMMLTSWASALNVFIPHPR
jgi:hypothetical protein